MLGIWELNTAEAVSEAAKTIPLLAGSHQIDGKPSAFACENFACLMPVMDPQVLAQQLDAWVSLASPIL
jgi:hypothetical protein